jgi:hypothetical protein
MKPVVVLNALRILEPHRWALRVRLAMSESSGHLDPAASELGVSRRTLTRWLRDPLLEDVMRAPAGRPWPAKTNLQNDNL